jgi:hypothetical protein
MVHQLSLRHFQKVDGFEYFSGESFHSVRGQCLDIPVVFDPQQGIEQPGRSQWDEVEGDGDGKDGGQQPPAGEVGEYVHRC